MRLIDADALKKDLKSVTLSNGTLVNTNAVLYLLEEYPTSYDVPGGWAYGWPKLYDPEKDGDLLEWIHRMGYKGTLAGVLVLVGVLAWC